MLWAQGSDAKLVIVGKAGWNVDVLLSKIEHHAALGSKLFCLVGVSDEFLEQIYATCDCLLAASFGEGFGLPILEASDRGMAILARNIPVFREIGEGQATFFDAASAEQLEVSITNWLAQPRSSMRIIEESRSRLSWSDCASQLLTLV